MLATTRKGERLRHESTIHTAYPPSSTEPQPQRCNCCSVGPSTYRAPFLGYFSKSCAISARSSVDSSTSPPARFSNVRFAFLPRPHGVHGQRNRQRTSYMWEKENLRGSGKRDHVVAESANPRDAQLRDRDAFPIRYGRQTVHELEVMSDILGASGYVRGGEAKRRRER